MSEAKPINAAMGEIERMKTVRLAPAIFFAETVAVEGEAFMTDERQLEELDKLIRKHVDRAETTYRQLLNRLWLAHAAGAGLIISFLGTHTSSRYNALFWPLTIFLAGLAALAVGDIVMLLKDRNVVKRNQSAFSLIDVIARDIEAPLDRIGLKGPRYKAQLVSAILLLLGVVAIFFAYLSVR